ncbi:MAG: Y-family DNA polymerase [Weeksellaceae bacterium]
MFALVDGNNFYASCERVFNPALNNKPVVVLSNNDGCVIARSNEAKQLGIPMGAPAFEYQKLFDENKVVVKSSNYALYGDMSNRMVNILRQFTPDLEVYSIDESFLQFKGFESFDLNSLGLEMHTRVLKWIGIPTSIGLAETKALAKIANKIAKKFPNQTHSVYSIDTEERRVKALKWTKIEDVWGIGRQISRKLQSIGIKNAYQFTQLPDDYVRKHFSVVGLGLKNELEGISTLSLEEAKPKKNIATTRSFDRNIFSLQDLEERVSTFAVTCAEKLRKQNSHCNHLMVFIHTNYHRQDLPQYSRNIIVRLPYPTNSNITLSQYALKGLNAIYKEGFSYKKAGVIVGGITPESNYQLSLFHNENPYHKPLMKVIDALNTKFGMKKLKLASQDPVRTWKMKQEKLSPSYTTSIQDIISVRL